MSDTYPVSEYFVSPQGEGVHSGVLMFFLRLAGCTVGKPFPKERYVVVKHCEFTCGGDPDIGHSSTCAYAKSASATIFVLPVYTEECHLYDGRKFPCDTDYRVKERLTPRQILEEIPKNVKDICITGGEPLMHNLDTLISYLWGEGKKIHIETSGTIDKYISPEIWVTVSPKFNIYKSMLKRANEIKLLVDKDFDPTGTITTLDDGMVQVINIRDLAQVKPVYLQPVNYENEVNSENLQRCLDIQKEYGSIFRISPQSHKLMSQYTKELVR